jgi:hypothetical protein
MTTAEYTALDGDPLSGVSAITDIKILKNNDACGSAVASNTTMYTPTVAEAHGTFGYVLQGSIPSFSSFYFGSSNIILPLQLLTFKGILHNNAAQLTWETSRETNTSRFVVERSTDGLNYTAIGNVNANGNTTSISKYGYNDQDVANLSSPVVYYRLKMVDVDAAFIYSNVISISLADITGHVSVSPNPAQGEVKLSVTAVIPGTIRWKLTDNTGRVVMYNTAELKIGMNNMMINTDKLPAGLYYITVNGDGIDQKIKLQKL